MGVGNGVVVGVGAPRGVVLGPVGRLHAGQRARPRARGWVSARRLGLGAGERAGGERGHHRHDDDIVVILHGAGRAPLWARRQVLAWGRRVQVWVQVGAPAHWCWDDSVVVVVVAFVVEGAVGVFRWHWGVSGEGGVRLTEWALSSPLSSLQPLHPLHPLLLLQCPRARWEVASWPCIVAVRGGGGGGARLSGARGLGQKLKT